MKRWLAPVAALSIVGVLAGSVVRSTDSTRASRNRIAAGGLGRLPLTFEPNVGQADASVKFLAHTGGTTLTLTSTEAALSLPGATSMARSAGRLPERAPSDVLGLAFIGSNPSVAVVGTDRLPGVSNYFIGNDPSAWRTGVAQYARVTYRDLYPGIDLTFYGNQAGRLEYDFTVRPGADPSPIRLGFRGADGLNIDSTGDLVIGLAHTSLHQLKPQIYQVVDGARTPISGGYALDRDQLSFDIGGFDRTRPLVIDPEVVYSTYLGGSGDEFAEEHPAVDGSGHVYICGITDSPDFPVTPGVVQPSFAGGDADGFISELTSDGSGVVYSTYIGSSGFDDADACAVDASGNLYMVGLTDSADFPTTEGAFQRRLKGGIDGVVVKLSPDGSRLLYSTYLGGSGDEFASTDGLAVDPAGDVVVTGDTNSTDFPTTPGAYQTANAGCQGSCKNPATDVVVVKLNASGSGLIFSTYLGGPGDDGFPANLALDAAGDVYVDWLTLSQRFPTTPGAFQPHLRGKTDVLVAKLDPTGSSLLYATYLGGGGDDLPESITVDAAGDAYVAGFTCSVNFPVTPGAFQTKNAGGRTLCWVVPGPMDGFVTKINSQGSGLVFSTYLGGSSPDSGMAVAGLDSSGHVILAGDTASTDFPVTPDAFQPTPRHQGGAPIIAELSADGSELIFSTYWGGSDFDVIHGSVLDASDNLYVTGCTRSTDFPVTPGAFQTTFQGGNGADNIVCLGPDDAFVTKVAFGS